MEQVKLIFFDLDRTLWDFEANSRRVITDLFHEYNLSSRCSIDVEHFLPVYENTNLTLWEKLKAGEISKQQLRKSRFYSSMLHFGYDDFELGFQLEEEYVQRSPYQKTLLPGTIETLDFLHERFSLHIITNGFKEVQRVKLNNSGLSRYFSQVIISEEAGFMKPEKEIFLKALQAAKCEAQHSIMIGDDVHADIMGAIAVGMHAVHLDSNASEISNAQFLKINSLPDLIQILRPAYSSKTSTL